MPKTAQTTGRCAYCGREMTCTGMGRHLRSCAARRESGERANRRRASNELLYHLRVRDDYGLGYWLHLEMNGSATLFDLDHYLRRIWLDCCAHMSAFTIRNVQYLEDFGAPFSLESGESLDARADAVFAPGLSFAHEYDFGTPTELSLRVMHQRRGRPTTDHAIVLMARNAALTIPCVECEKPAQLICLDCEYEGAPGEGHICLDHIAGHVKHDDYGKMPIFNSPRSGVCGYDGPAEPPY